MESSDRNNLRTASSYINNLLLSRGLLRDGQSLEFARPEKGEGGVEGTMGRVMSLVNDLILRRDRDAQQRESLSQTIRTLRADGLRYTTDLERLQAKHAEAQRRLGLTESTERALKAQLRSAEQAARGLKEEMGRMRVLVAQTRAACGNEVRKRERVIEGLKKHVGEGGRPRGSGKAVGLATITVVAGVGADDAHAQAVATTDSGYDLRMETNEFLTALAKGLSEENENLGGLVRRTVETLKTLSGWEREGVQEGGMVVVTDSGYESLAAEMDGVTEHLRTLLTNPSFVPLEEVEVREDEIIRLREGWEKMEARWREAVQMMDGWRKRMTRSGQTVKLEELNMGLRLSPLKESSIEDSLNQPDQEADESYEGDTQADIDAMDDSQVPVSVDPMSRSEELESDASSAFEEDVIEEDSAQSPTQELHEVSQDSQQLENSLRHDESPDKQTLEEEHQFSLTSASSSSFLCTPPQLSPLREISNTGNRGKGFTTIIEENTWDLAQIDHSPIKNENSALKKEDAISVIKPSSAQTQRSSRKPSLAIQPTSSSRLPRPASAAFAQQSPLTMASIAAKLAATEREADAARVRAKLKAAKLSSAAAAASSSAATTLQPPRPTHEGQDMREPEKEQVPLGAPEDATRKRKAARKSHGGKFSRRRSTLSPWELESLILGAPDGGV